MTLVGVENDASEADSDEIEVGDGSESVTLISA
jgi:hypothetical protein